MPCPNKTTEQPTRGLTFQLRTAHRKRLAFYALGISLVIGLRWNYANLTPTFPVGESVARSDIRQGWEKTPQPNAAHFYMAAEEMLRPGVVRDRSEITIAEQKESVKDAAEALALVRQGMKYPYYGANESKWYSGRTPAEIDRPLPTFIPQRNIARLLAMDSCLKRNAGDASGAMSAALDSIRFGVDLSQEDSMMQGLISGLPLMIGQNEALLSIPKLSAPDARASIARLEKMVPLIATYAQVVTSEKKRIYAALQKHFDQESEMIDFYDMEWSYRSGDPEKIEKRDEFDKAVIATSKRILYRSVLFIYTRQGLVNDYAAAMDQQIARAKMSYQKASVLDPISPPHNWSIVVLVPNLSRGLTQYTGRVARNQILLGQLAVQAYKGEHSGKLPASLVVLTQGSHPYLKTIPYDPFSCDGTAPLRYDPIHGEVYSVAENGVDDHALGDDADLVYKKTHH